MSNNLFIKNGHLVDPAGGVDLLTNIVVKNGKVAELTQSTVAPRDATVIDATGCIVAPGFIDMHVHFREPGYEYKEDILSGCRAAAAGGFTSVACMANTNPVNDCASVMQTILKRARDANLINVYPIGAITKGLKGETLADIGDLASLGAVALSDDGMVINNPQVLKRAMQYASTFDLPIISHCEVSELVDDGVMNEGIMSNRLGVIGRPIVAEAISIFRDCMLAEYADCRLHVAHLTSRRGLDVIKWCRSEGVLVTTEVCPHHLFLTEDSVNEYNVNAKMNPPLRRRSDCKALIEGLKNGEIQAIVTDHAPHSLTDKEVGLENASPGIVGLETSVSLCLKMVEAKQLTMSQLVNAYTVGPATILKLNKGTLAVGADADITMFNPNEGYTINPNEFYTRGRNTPFAGWKVYGRIKATIVGGRVVFPFK